MDSLTDGNLSQSWLLIKIDVFYGIFIFVEINKCSIFEIFIDKIYELQRKSNIYLFLTIGNKLKTEEQQGF